MLNARVVAALLLPPTLFLLTGCTSSSAVPPEELRPEEAVRAVLTEDGDKVPFDEPTVAESDTLFAEVYGQPLLFALSDVELVVVKRSDPLKTVGAVFGSVFLLAVVGLMVLAAYCSSNDCFGTFQIPAGTSSP